MQGEGSAMNLDAGIRATLEAYPRYQEYMKSIPTFTIVPKYGIHTNLNGNGKNGNGNGLFDQISKWLYDAGFSWEKFGQITEKLETGLDETKTSVFFFPSAFGEGLGNVGQGITDIGKGIAESFGNAFKEIMNNPLLIIGGFALLAVLGLGAMKK